MPAGYYCYTAAMAEESLLAFRAELISKGIDPVQAEIMVRSVKIYHLSDAVRNAGMLVPAGVKHAQGIPC